MKKIIFIGLILSLFFSSVLMTIFFWGTKAQFVNAKNIENEQKVIPVAFKENKTSANTEFKLKVPYFVQEYEKSCEASALRMVLDFYGIKTNDWDILQKVGYNPRGMSSVDGVWMWDDPHKMFVGDVSKDKNGYGVYAEPIAKTAKSYGRNAYVYKNISARFLSEQIRKGHPVILWGYSTYLEPVKYEWQTEGGKRIFGYRGEHTRVVTGFKGNPSNPDGFFVHDPNPEVGGDDQYWTTDELLENMNIMGDLSNQSVVVM